jgi:chorismate dehydratase
MLLIGDKVVTDAPPVEQYPYQIDLGRAWNELTELPFVFATWLCRDGADLGDLPDLLAQQRIANRTEIDRIVEKYATKIGWPPALARRYLADWLHYEIGSAELQAITRFAELAAKHQLIEHERPLRLYDIATP